MDGKHIHPPWFANMDDHIPQGKKQKEIPGSRRTSKEHEDHHGRVRQNRMGKRCGRKNDEKDSRHANNVHVQ